MRSKGPKFKPHYKPMHSCKYCPFLYITINLYTFNLFSITLQSCSRPKVTLEQFFFQHKYSNSFTNISQLFGDSSVVSADFFAERRRGIPTSHLCLVEKEEKQISTRRLQFYFANNIFPRTALFYKYN